MAGRKLVRDLFLHRQSLLQSQQQVSGTKIRLLSENGYSGNRRFSVFNEFSEQVKEETSKNPPFKMTVKESKEQVEELKGVKEDLKVRTKQTTEHSGCSDTAETLFGKFRSRNVSSVFHRFKEAKFVDMAKKGYHILKDELNGSPSKKKYLGFDPSSIPRVERRATSDIAVQSRWSKKWEAFRMKMQGNNPLFKRISGISEPVEIKSEEIIDDMKELIAQ